uniref:Uncharacterized protein n=1 Tax=viral metagenome TaxID=1070528 RepID=A0A6C0IDQ5_9ZZZZ
MTIKNKINNAGKGASSLFTTNFEGDIVAGEVW